MERALEAQTPQLELKRRQGDARRKRTEDLEAVLESRSAEVAGLNAQLTDARHRIIELRSALIAEVMQLQSVKVSTSWRLTLPLRWFAGKFPWSACRLRRVLKLRFGELPPLSGVLCRPDWWDLIDGLSAEAVETPAVVTGQRILRLVAAGADGRHALGARFGGLAPSQSLSRHRLGQGRARCPRDGRSP